jgi:hypothetical protein
MALLITAVTLGILLNVYVYRNNITAETIDKTSLGDNYYEKFTGEKITLDTEEEELDGKWGKLYLNQFILQPTIKFVKEQTDLKALKQEFKSSSKWTFENASLDDIRNIFLKAGLNEETIEGLMLSTTALNGGKGFVTVPPDETLWQFTPEIRSKLYPMIGSYKGNMMYSEPVCYNSDSPKEWFYNSRLNEDIIEKMSSLIYIEDGICYISDLHLILPLLTNEEDEANLVQTIYRTKSLQAELQVDEAQDINKLAAYWGNLSDKSYVLAILKKAGSDSSNGRIDISELMPSIPQNRLNTYSGEEEFGTDYKDCHWTTINFFNNEVDERYYVLPNLFWFFSKISKPVQDDSLKFGDIVTMFDNNENMTHSCTYIADNLVLTKNGMGNLNPFVLTYLDKTAPLYGGNITYYTRTVSNTQKVELLSGN